MKFNPVTWWIQEFGSFAPVGHGLRVERSSSWTRFHSLAKSKRYPETVSEYLEAINRNLTIANELFVLNEPVYVYRSQFHEKKLRGKLKYKILDHQLREYADSLPSTVSEDVIDPDDRLSVRALTATWPPKFFTELLREVADDKLRHITFVSPATKNIYCPYDGGMDIFTTPSKWMTLESKYSTWMSDQSSRL